MEPSCNTSDGDLPFIDLPIIDIVKLKGQSGDVEKTKETQKLIDAFTEVGFCLLKNMEQVGYRREDIKKWMDWFYLETTPDERLDQLGLAGFNPKNRLNVYRGLFPAEKGKLSCKEALDMGEDFRKCSKPSNKERANNPMMSDTPRFEFSDPHRQKQADKFFEVMYDQFRVLKGAGYSICSSIAEHGGEPSDYFDPMFGSMDEGGSHCFRTIMYPQRNGDEIPPKAVLADGKIISTPAHADSGGVTLLQTFGYPGLELMLDNKWYQVPPIEDCLVVNVGEYMSRMSNNRFKATIHRVMDIGRNRFSNPFFYGPLLDANLNAKLPNALLQKTEGFSDVTEDTEREEYVPWGAFLIRKLKVYSEWQNLYDSLPEWMMEKYMRPNFKGTQDWATANKILTDGKAGDIKEK